MTDIQARIVEYLDLGGFFNPEAMSHEQVRTLIMDAADEICRLRARLAEVSSPATPQELPDGPICDLLAFGQAESTSALARKDRDDYQFWQGWNSALERVGKGAASPATPGLELVNKIIDRLTMRTDQMRQQMRDDKAMAKGESKILLRHALEASADLHEGFANAMCCDVEDFEKWRGELASLHQKDE